MVPVEDTPASTSNQSSVQAEDPETWKKKFFEVEKKLKITEHKLKEAQKKCEKADTIILKNERLKVRMKRNHKSQYQKFKRKIKILEKKIIHSWNTSTKCLHLIK